MSLSYAAKLASLQAGTLAPKDFSHRDHIGIAYEALVQTGYFDALHVVAGGLQALAIRAGVPEKFNATVTAAYMSLIAERMQAAAYRGAEDFLTRNADLLTRGCLMSHYSESRLTSELARTVALLPDAARL